MPLEPGEIGALASDLREFQIALANLKGKKQKVVVEIHWPRGTSTTLSVSQPAFYEFLVKQAQEVREALARGTREWLPGEKKRKV